jgi:hypothetical protein
MRSLMVCSLAALASTGAGAPRIHAMETTGVLVNDTGETWRIRPAEAPRVKTAYTLTLHVADRTPKRHTVSAADQDRCEIELIPGAELRIAHREPPGQVADCWLDIAIELASGLTTPAGMEGHLHFRTCPSLVPWRPDQTTLHGCFYADGRPRLFRFTPQPGARLVLEADLDDAPPGCVIL